MISLGDIIMMIGLIINGLFHAAVFGFIGAALITAFSTATVAIAAAAIIAGLVGFLFGLTGGVFLFLGDVGDWS